jgi:TPR repeat protein
LLRYFKLSADQDNIKAKFCLGRCYKDGQGCPKDGPKAFACFKFAADKGDVEVEYKMVFLKMTRKLFYLTVAARRRYCL